MEKILANFLKGMGITPDLIQDKMQTLLTTAQAYDGRMARMELQNNRIERMLIAICASLNVSIVEIYTTPEAPQNGENNDKPENAE